MSLENKRLTLSYSTYSELMKCGKRIIFKRTQAKGPLSASLLYGQLLHSGLHAAYTGKDPIKVTNEALDYYCAGQMPPGEREQANWDGTLLFTKNDSPVDVMRTWIPQAIAKYLEQYKDVPLLMETTFTRDYGDFDLIGIVDVVRPGLVIDYKLGNERYKPDPLQAAFYALLMRGPTNFEFHVFRKRALPDLPEVFQIKEASDPKYLKYVEEMILPGAAQMLGNADLPANPGNYLCDERFCAYWNLCLGKIQGTQAKKEN